MLTLRDAVHAQPQDSGDVPVSALTALMRQTSDQSRPLHYEHVPDNWIAPNRHWMTSVNAPERDNLWRSR